MSTGGDDLVGGNGHDIYGSAAIDHCAKDTTTDILRLRVLVVLMFTGSDGSTTNTELKGAEMMMMMKNVVVWCLF